MVTASMVTANSSSDLNYHIMLICGCLLLPTNLHEKINYYVQYFAWSFEILHALAMQVLVQEVSGSIDLCHTLSIYL